VPSTRALPSWKSSWYYCAFGCRDWENVCRDWEKPTEHPNIDLLKELLNPWASNHKTRSAPHSTVTLGNSTELCTSYHADTVEGNTEFHQRLMYVPKWNAVKILWLVRKIKTCGHRLPILLQFERTNAQNFVKVTILQHTAAGWWVGWGPQHVRAGVL
jgi:hypothetical protein